ncbi:olfactory receptor 52I2-like [Sphaerodactylus townsendi]|uniref:olfactory receptor 52I2-like n=1 Tax=Sphaerodactylus townsendi TaxID=933632 RepID=UPI002025E1F5|nr:olfactory receptor 52I2-like [Sphaerodactylus townsendi]
MYSPQMDLDTNSSPSAFFLIGISGLESAHPWLGLPFCIMYIVALLGNSALLLAIRLDRTLHNPMFYFLGMLGVIDVVMATSTVPKMLDIFWEGSPKIGSNACFIQMFLIHSVTAMESGVLLAMAFDRYVAIGHPLRYEAILTPRRVAQIGLAILVRGVLFMVPLSWMVSNLPYCASRRIPHSYCEHMAVVKLACVDSTASHVYIVAGSTLIVGSDTAFIAVSYGLVLRAVRKLSEKAEQLKAFSTCSSHLCVMLLYYLPGMASIYMQGFRQGAPPHAQVLLADLYLILPPTLNPVIYSIRMKQVRKALRRVFPFGPASW